MRSTGDRGTSTTGGTLERDTAARRAVGVGRSGHRRSAARRELHLGDGVEPAVPVHRQLDGEQAAERGAVRASFDVPRVIQTNAANNIAGSLTTIAQEGSFGVIDTSDRSMLYLYPSFSFAVNRWGSHDFKAGAELYPFLRNKTSREITPLEFYYRPPGTTGAPTSCSSATRSGQQRHGHRRSTTRRTSTSTAGYFQDRWKPRQQHLDQSRLPHRFESHLHEGPRGGARPGAAGRFPDGHRRQGVHTDDVRAELRRSPGTSASWGVIRGTAGRYYEWLDLGGGDGTSHPPYVVADRRGARQPADGCADAEPDAAGRVCARRQLRLREQEDLHQRVQRRLGKAAAAHELGRA